MDRMNTKELIYEVNSLPVEERALVADSVLKSLNPPEPDIDQEWVSIAKKRLSELKQGVKKAIPGKQVFRNIWNDIDK